MTHFSTNYNRINFPIANDQALGLRNAQLGAIHSIGMHFSLYAEEPALIVLPTGSGKTAVLVLSPYLLRSKRVLVLSSSILVRGQIFHEFNTLEVLKRLNVFHKGLEPPKVFEIKSPIKSTDDWKSLTEFDVAIGIPGSINAGINSDCTPPADLFDLILVDEAHHTPAFTWNNTIEAFPNAKKIYFTATPFRRDKKEIEGRLVYNYPISKAYEDKIFGDIGYIAVQSDGSVDSDILIAQKAEQIFAKDRADKLDHYLLVRTDSKEHADKLEILYRENTSLNLRKIHSRLSFQNIKKTINDLKSKKLDGIICVNMLGEGVDFPNLKIAAIHAPQKSLGATLQFIGRFARTNAENIGAAKFIALEHDVRFRTHELYTEGKIWNEIIHDLSETRIKQEDTIKKVLDTFTEVNETVSTESVSLYNLTPYCHVKIYKAQGFDIHGVLQIANHEILHHFKSQDESVAFFITKESVKPKWIQSDELINTKHYLFLVFFDTETNLLFIHSTIKTTQFYDAIASRFCESFSKVPKNMIHKVLAGLKNTRIFNMGLQNRSISGETYLTKAGPDTQNTISLSDARIYSNGHVFGTGEMEGLPVTIGYSSGAKVWSNAYEQLPVYISWCKVLGKKIVSNAIVKTNSGFDNIPIPTVVDKLPSGVIPYSAIWNEQVFDDLPRLIIRSGDELIHSEYLFDVDITIDQDKCNQNEIAFDLSSDDFRIPMTFNFRDFYMLDSNNSLEIEVVIGNEEPLPIIEYFNENALKFYLTDFSTLVNNNELIQNTSSESLIFNPEQIVDFPWDSYKIDISKEFGKIKNGDKISIHEGLSNYLMTQELDTLIYDHGAGETADFIAIQDTTSSITIELFHVKASAKDKAGDRVNDVYEVCGQATKSLIWTVNRNRFKKKINARTRNRNDKFLKGNLERFNQIMEQQKQVKFYITIVQPGIRKELSPKIATVLAATNDFIKNNGNNETLKVLGTGTKVIENIN